MRILIAAAAITLCAGTAHAELYSNAKYGFSITVPDMLEVGREEPDAGDGMRSHSADQKADFTAYAGFLLDSSFAAEVKGNISQEEGGGWKVSYRKLGNKKWATYSGAKNGRIFYVRSIPSCHGGAIALYRLEYPAADKAKYNPIIKALNDSFIDNDGCKLSN